MSRNVLRVGVRQLPRQAGLVVLAVALATGLPALAARVQNDAPALPSAARGPLPGSAPALSPQAAWQQECGACHLAYPAELLPATAWRRLMAGLDHHFGVDASLEAAVQASIARWLGSQGTGAGAGPADNRITHTDWFREEHAELPSAAFRRPAVKSAANCGACHGAADQGKFDEHSVRIPR